MTSGIDLLIAGKIFDAVIGAFTIVNFGADLFYLIILLGGLTLMFIKNKSIGMITVVLILIGQTVMSSILPSAHKYLYALMFLGAMSLIYYTFKSKGY